MVETELETRSFSGSNLKTISIVLADDHEIVRAGLRNLLESTPGLEVVGEAKDGAEACERVAETNPDVVVIDVSMPVMNGAQAAERLRQEFPDVAILALTMHDDRGHLTRLLDAGVSGYLLKRAAADELVRAIRTVAEGGTYVDPKLAGSVLRKARNRGPGTFGGGTVSLSEREEAVLRQIAWGHSNQEIAQQLSVSTKTVETYKARITEKLGLKSRNDMVRYAVQQGWLTE
jgi:DNA-binding NarL/FixJ family response regulator